jgi:uncharacterized tellurite resistance protein B-like protein
MSGFQVRSNRKKIEVEETEVDLIVVEGKGSLPISIGTVLNFVTSVFDVTDGGTLPVRTWVKELQEKNSIAFQSVKNLGLLLPSQRWSDWYPVGIIPTDVLMPSDTGKRDLDIVVRIVDSELGAAIHEGYCPAADKGNLGTYVCKEQIFFETPELTKPNCPGCDDADDVTGPDDDNEFYCSHCDKYFTAGETSDEEEDSSFIRYKKSVGLIVKLALAVAYADGEFHHLEGKIIKEWATELRNRIPSHYQEQIKSEVNDSLSDGTQMVKDGKLLLNEILFELDELAQENLRYEAYELCQRVLEADGVADSNELASLQEIAEVLKLNTEEVDKTKKLLVLNGMISQIEEAKSHLGISDNTPKQTVLDIIKKEFKKWNANVTALKGEEEKNVRNYLNVIAEIKKEFS